MTRQMFFASNRHILDDLEILSEKRENEIYDIDPKCDFSIVEQGWWKNISKVKKRMSM